MKHLSFSTATAAGFVLLLVGSVLFAPSLAAEEDAGTLIISTDSPCTFLVDDVVLQRIDPGEPFRLQVEPGFRTLTALSLYTLEASWETGMEIDEDEEYEIQILLADDVEDLIGDVSELIEEPAPPLEDLGDGIYHDTETDLYWTQLDNNFDIDWDAAERYCSTLQLKVEDDPERPWRLPQVEELETLLDNYSRGDFNILQGVRLSGCCPWTSEHHGSVSAWYFSFADGRRGFVTRDYNEGGRVLCVR